MTDDKTVTPGAFAALQASFEAQSRKAQAYYTAMYEIRKVVKGDDAASAWMSQALPALAGKTPAEAVAEGRVQDVLDIIRALAA